MPVRENHSSDGERQRALRAICHPVLDDMEALVTAAVTRIRNELAGYERVPLQEHRSAVREQLRRRTVCIIEERPPDESDLRQAAELARSRAHQAITIETLISAYHIGDRELWRRIADSAKAEHTWVLPDVAAQVMESLHTLSGTLAAAHSEVTRSLHGHRITLTHRLIELLAEGPVTTEAARIAEALSVPTNAAFQALVWSPVPGRAGVSPELYRVAERAGEQLLYSSRGNELILLSWSTSASRLSTFAKKYLGEGRCGLGLAREGLAGAAASIGDAFLALNTAHAPRAMTAFEDEWVQCTVLALSARLQPLLARACTIAAEHEHLAQTVEAFARNSMSVAATSQELSVHANTVTYRLERWSRLAGWNPRSLDGLFKSAIACLLARTEPPAEPGGA